MFLCLFFVRICLPLLFFVNATSFVCKDGLFHSKNILLGGYGLGVVYVESIISKKFNIDYRLQMEEIHQYTLSIFIIPQLKHFMLRVEVDFNGNSEA